MSIFKLKVENKSTGFMFEVEEYGNSCQEILDFWHKLEADGNLGDYHLLSCVQVQS